MRSRIQILFLLGLGLMVLFRVLKILPFFQGEIMGFDGPKVLKILIGLLFILASFFLYRNSKNTTA